MITLLSCKSRTEADVLGKYESRGTSSRLEAYKYSFLYAKGGPFSTACALYLHLKDDHQFEQRAKDLSGYIIQTGNYEVKNNSVELTFSNGRKINLKIRKNGLFRVDKTDDYPVIYKLVKVE
jgi:hypothetical protein